MATMKFFIQIFEAPFISFLKDKKSEVTKQEE
jgi:hypothetical protein